jgi:hypothetical protein
LNYSKIKENVIKKRWSETKGKYGDDYRNLSKQIDNFIDHIKKADSPLHWLPLEIMTDEEMADIVNGYLDRSDANRLLLYNLDFKGIKYDYSDLIVKDPRLEDEWRIILETTPELKKYQKLKILELITEINIVLVDAPYVGYMKTAVNLLKYIDLIYDEIIHEKNLFKCIGLGYKNTEYIEQYITVCERIVDGALFFLLISNPNISDKIDALLKIEEKLNSAYDTIEEELSVAKEKLICSRKLEKVYYKCNPNDATNISIFYVQFLERQSYYGEIENIIMLLKDEIHNRSDLYGVASSLPYENIDDYSKSELKNYICEEIKVSDYDKKYSEISKIIDFALSNKNMWASNKNALDVKIAFREFFLSKQKYMRKTSTAMVRNILAGITPEPQDMMFLDMKIIRGCFREKNMLQEYEIYNRICSRVRHMFLKSYSAINDVEAYRLVHRSCFEFLYLFGDSKYSGIKIE